MRPPAYPHAWPASCLFCLFPPFHHTQPALFIRLLTAVHPPAYRYTSACLPLFIRLLTAMHPPAYRCASASPLFHHARPALCLRQPIYTLHSLLAAFSRCFTMPGLHYASAGLSTCSSAASCFVLSVHHARPALCPCWPNYMLCGLLGVFFCGLITPRSPLHLHQPTYILSGLLAAFS